MTTRELIAEEMSKRDWNYTDKDFEWILSYANEIEIKNSLGKAINRLDEAIYGLEKRVKTANEYPNNPIKFKKYMDKKGLINFSYEMGQHFKKSFRSQLKEIKLFKKRLMKLYEDFYCTKMWSEV